MTKELPFLNHVWTTCRPSLVLTLDSFSDECGILCQDLQALRAHVNGADKSKRWSTSWGTKWKGAVWCAVHPNCVVGPYYFKNKIVKGVNWIKMMDTYVLSKAQQFQQNAVFWQDGVSSHNTWAVKSIFDEMCPILWIGKYGPTGWPPRSPHLSPL